MLEGDASCPGSLGIAISEAVEATVTSAVPTKYALGSVLNHVLMHQTIIGQEAIKQMEMVLTPAPSHPHHTLPSRPHSVC